MPRPLFCHSAHRARVRCGAQAAERRRLLQQQNAERAAHKEERLKLIYQVEALMTQVRAAARS